jgi:hypothetical protein
MEVWVVITQCDPSSYTTIRPLLSAEGHQDFHTFFFLSFVDVTQHKCINNSQ